MKGLAHAFHPHGFLEELEDDVSDEYADRTLKAVIAWGRYGEIFAYDETTDAFSLENPE